MASGRQRKEVGQEGKAESASEERARKKLSYLEQREYDGIEARIASAEEELQRNNRELADPKIATDAARLVALQQSLETAQAKVDALYARWAELEAKVSW